MAVMNNGTIPQPPVMEPPPFAPTADRNPVTELADHLTQDTHRAPLDKALWALVAVGVVSLAGPSNYYTLAFRLLGFGSAVGLVSRNDEGRKTRRLVTTALFHHQETITLAREQGAHAGRVQGLGEAQTVVDELQARLQEAGDRVREWEAASSRIADEATRNRNQISQQKIQLQHEMLGFEQLKADYKQEFEGLRSENIALGQQIEAARSLLSEQQGQVETAIAEALEQQAGRFQLQVAELEKQVLGLGAARDLARQRLEVERSLPEAKDLIIEGKMGPILIAAQQGGGKGTSCLSLLSSYADKFGGVVPFVLDPTVDDGWLQAGIMPYGEDERDLFFNVVRTVWNTREQRLHRNAPGFDQQPPIVFVIDEVGILYAGMERGDKKNTALEWNNLLSRVNKGGAKFGIFNIYLSKSFQVKGMRHSGIEPLNASDMMNMNIMLINTLVEPFTDYTNGCKFREGDQPKLESQAGEYIAAVATSNYGARSLALVKHPTHFGQPLSQGSPSRPITPPGLAKYPDYCPEFGESRYYELRPDLQVSHAGETNGEIQRNGGETVGKLRGRNGIEAVRDVYPEDSILASETVETQNPNLDTWLESDEISPEERRRIIECHSQGRNQKTTVLEIYNRKPGRSRTYKCAAQKVRTVYGELSPVK